jgi:hypothetical protein
MPLRGLRTLVGLMWSKERDQKTPISHGIYCYSNAIRFKVLQ